jgi:lipoprotein signal peptidase
MKDFHAHALSFEIKPTVFRRFTPFSRYTIIVALREPSDATATREKDNAGWQATIAGIKTAFDKTWPQDDFNYNFLDETIANAYQAQQRTLHLLNWATGLTIIISCLGLLGLVMYTTNRRIKEIGVRKVLGASVTNIVSILSKEFLLLVVIAFAIAIPLSWWAGAVWMSDFPYRTPISWWVFALAGSGMVLLAFITLSIQTIRAARANPIKSLRIE